MANKMLSYFLCIMPLVISMVSNGAAFEVRITALSPETAQKRAPITVFNATDCNISIEIFSLSKEHESWRTFHDTRGDAYKTIRPHQQSKVTTVMGFGPYAVKLSRSDESIYFKIPAVTSDTEIQIGKNSKRFFDIDLWYRGTQTREQNRQSALAIMEATHERTGAERRELGGSETYKQIAEHLLNSWQKAPCITTQSFWKSYHTDLGL